MKTDNVIKEKSYHFAIRTIKLCLWLKGKKEFEIASQLLRAGTSIGANVEEALAGYTRKDFLHRMAVARKGAREAHYWLRLLRDAEILSESQSHSIIDESEELVRILTSIVKTGQNNTKEA